MRHLIATRLGIGLSHPISFRRRTQLLLNTLLPGMAAQTSQNFKWAVVTEHTLDAKSREALLAAFAPHPNFSLVEINSFDAGDQQLPLGRIADERFGTAKGVVFTRVDDDDALALDFVETVQDKLKRVEGLAVLNMRSGAAMHPATGRIVRKEARSGSVGQTFLVEDLYKSDHQSNHRLAHEKIQARGGRSIIVRASGPYWLSVLYDFSESRALRAPNEIVDGIERHAADALPLSVLTRFALPETICATLQHVVEGTPEARAPMNNVQMKRMGIKKQFLMLARETREALLSATDEKHKNKARERLDALKAAYYAF